MSSKKIVRSVLVALVAVGLLIGPAGAAFAAPDRGEGARTEWRVDVGEWAGVVWGWLFGVRDADKGSESTNDDGGIRSLSGENDGSGGWDPNG